MSTPAERARPSFYDVVWEIVRAVPPGTVVTYGQVALIAGSPAAARATGYALSNLPSDTDVPWWRVINASGGISLRGRGSNADLQRALLAREGVVFDEHDRVDLKRYRWWPEARD